MKFSFSLFILLFTSIYLYGQSTDCSAPFFEFDIPEEEKGCMAHFDINANGYHPVNTFLLAKMTELMYPERLDYQFRYLKDRQVADTLISTKWLVGHSVINEGNFECAFKKRFRHYFPKGEKVDFKFIHETEHKKVLGISTKGFDPEVMLISTSNAVFIIFRGTDNVGDDMLAEWTGTDFKIGMKQADGALEGIKIHRGFWNSFQLIRDEMISTLGKFDAKNKKIWIAGHSLGGAMTILSAAYLEGAGFPIQQAYTFASPRTVGGKKFKEKVEQLLSGKINRFEYYLDPIPFLWSPPYKNNGIRNWYQEEKNKYQLFTAIKERYVSPNPTEFNFIPFVDKRNREEVKSNRQKYNALMTELKLKMHFHNPQWYVKAAYEQLDEQQKKKLPKVDDSFPFIYYGAKFGK